VPDENALRVRWGVLDLPLEVRDAEKHLFTTVNFGGLSPFRFIFGESGPAVALEVEGRRVPRI
jgi:hypothetical protein